MFIYIFLKSFMFIHIYSLGAVQQEARIARAVEIMLMYVDNLKRNCEREHTELEESRKLLAANNLSVEDQWRSNSGLEVSFIFIQYLYLFQFMYLYVIVFIFIYRSVLVRLLAVLTVEADQFQSYIQIKDLLLTLWVLPW